MKVRTLFLTCLIFLSYYSFSQNFAELKESKHRFSIEPYINIGSLDTRSEIKRYRFQAMPGLNFGMQLNKRSSITLGSNFSYLNEVYYPVLCNNGPCPDMWDYKFIDVSLGYKYKVFNKDNITIEPFINIYKQYVMYAVSYLSYDKEGQHWEHVKTPYPGLKGFAIGAYFNHSLTKHVTIFASPSFSTLYIYNHRIPVRNRVIRPVIGSRFGTRITF